MYLSEVLAYSNLIEIFSRYILQYHQLFTNCYFENIFVVLKKETLNAIREFAKKGCPVSWRARIWLALLTGATELDPIVWAGLSIMVFVAFSMPFF